jgi:hypothetical protein
MGIVFFPHDFKKGVFEGIASFVHPLDKYALLFARGPDGSCYYGRFSFDKQLGIAATMDR